MNRLVMQRTVSAANGDGSAFVVTSHKRHLVLLALCASLLGWAVAPPVHAEQITLTRSGPERLVVDPAGKPQRITIFGTNFENASHPDTYEYMHWQVRRADGSWMRGNATPDLTLDGSSGNQQSFKIGGSFVSREGYVEVRVFRGLGHANITEPSQAHNLVSGWSNVLRLPVVALTAPTPVIKSLSKSKFPVGGKPEDFRFVIDVDGLNGQAKEEVAVHFYDGDTRKYAQVTPERIEAGHLVHVRVPENVQRTSPGALTLVVRTLRGAESNRWVPIEFVPPPKTMQVSRPGAPDINHDADSLRVGQGGFVPSAGAAKTGPKSDDPGQFRGGFVPGGAAKTATHSSNADSVDPKQISVTPAQGALAPSSGMRTSAPGFSNAPPVGIATPGPLGSPGGIKEMGAKGPESGPGKGGLPDSIRNPGGVKAIGPKQDDPSRPGVAGRWDDNSTQGGVRAPGGIKAIGPKQDDPAGPGKAGRQASGGIGGDAGTPGGLRNPGGIKAIGPKQDDPGRPANRASGGIQDDTVMPGGMRTPGGIKAIGPKQDDPATPGKSGAQQTNAAGDGKIGTPGGIKAIGPKQDDPATPPKAGAQGVIAPIDIRSVQQQPLRQ